MNKKVWIASDSTSDLGGELIERYQVQILPLGISLGDKEYTDGVDIDAEVIYRHYERTGELPKTSAVNVADYQDFFARCTEQDGSVVLFTISAKMSSSYQNACIAAAEFDDVYVVDTRSLSTGGGLLVAAAGDMAAKGMPAREIAAACSELSARVDASFVIDSLEFLHKGGRCSGVAALGANLLHLKPCISVHDGSMTVGKKYRGNFAAVLEQYIADRLGDGASIDSTRAFVTHAGCEDELCRRCVAQVRESGLFDEVILTRAGCTISSHCGRNTLGVLFIRNTPLA